MGQHESICFVDIMVTVFQPVSGFTQIAVSIRGIAKDCIAAHFSVQIVARRSLCRAFHAPYDFRYCGIDFRGSPLGSGRDALLEELLQ